MNLTSTNREAEILLQAATVNAIRTMNHKRNIQNTLRQRKSKIIYYNQISEKIETKTTTTEGFQINKSGA